MGLCYLSASGGQENYFDVISGIVPIAKVCSKDRRIDPTGKMREPLLAYLLVFTSFLLTSDGASLNLRTRAAQEVS